MKGRESVKAIYERRKKSAYDDVKAILTDKVRLNDALVAAQLFHNRKPQGSGYMLDYLYSPEFNPIKDIQDNLGRAAGALVGFGSKERLSCGYTDKIILAQHDDLIPAERDAQREAIILSTVCRYLESVYMAELKDHFNELYQLINDNPNDAEIYMAEKDELTSVTFVFSAEQAVLKGRLPELAQLMQQVTNKYHDQPSQVHEKALSAIYAVLSDYDQVNEVLKLTPAFANLAISYPFTSAGIENETKNLTMENIDSIPYVGNVDYFDNINNYLSNAELQEFNKLPTDQCVYIAAVLNGLFAQADSPDDFMRVTKSLNVNAMHSAIEKAASVVYVTKFLNELTSLELIVDESSVHSKMANDVIRYVKAIHADLRHSENINRKDMYDDLSELCGEVRIHLELDASEGLYGSISDDLHEIKLDYFTAMIRLEMLNAQREEDKQLKINVLKEVRSSYKKLNISNANNKDAYARLVERCNNVVDVILFNQSEAGELARLKVIEDARQERIRLELVAMEQCSVEITELTECFPTEEMQQLRHDVLSYIAARYVAMSPNEGENAKEYQALADLCRNMVAAILQKGKEESLEAFVDNDIEIWVRYISAWMKLELLNIDAADDELQKIKSDALVLIKGEYLEAVNRPGKLYDVYKELITKCNSTLNTITHQQSDEARLARSLAKEQLKKAELAAIIKSAELQRMIANTALAAAEEAEAYARVSAAAISGEPQSEYIDDIYAALGVRSEGQIPMTAKASIGVSPIDDDLLSSMDEAAEMLSSAAAEVESRKEEAELEVLLQHMAEDAAQYEPALAVLESVRADSQAVEPKATVAERREAIKLAKGILTASIDPERVVSAASRMKDFPWRSLLLIMAGVAIMALAITAAVFTFGAAAPLAIGGIVLGVSIAGQAIAVTAAVVGAAGAASGVGLFARTVKRNNAAKRNSTQMEDLPDSALLNDDGKNAQPQHESMHRVKRIRQ